MARLSEKPVLQAFGDGSTVVGTGPGLGRFTAAHLLAWIRSQLPSSGAIFGVGNVSGLQAALDAKQSVSQKGQANGYAPLGADNLLPNTHLPADVVRTNHLATIDTFGGNYTLAATDRNRTKMGLDTVDRTVTLTPQPAGFICKFAQGNTGRLSFVTSNPAGSQVLSFENRKRTAGLWAEVTVTSYGTNWLISGPLVV